jgi:N-glycosylase/DNA lyase
MIAIPVSVSAPAGFHLKATALSHGWHECSPMSWSEGGQCFQVIDRIKDEAYRVSVVQPSRGGRRSRRLNITIETSDRNGADPSAAIDELVRRLRLSLGLERDLSEFYRLCASHPVLRVAPAIGAGRIIRSASMTENIVKAICGTNVNWTQAVKMINRIGQLGPIVPHFRSQSAWPTPREILRAGDRYLKDVCRLGYRTDSILAFCRDVAERRFDPDKLDSLAADPAVSSEEIVKVLLKIPGVGPSSANYLVGFLGRHDRLSIDTSTVAHVRAMHTNGKKPTFKQIERIYASYGKWKNLVWWVESWLQWGTARSMLSD